MDKRDIKLKIIKTLETVKAQKNPNISLIKECIDLIHEEGLEDDMKEELDSLSMLHTMGTLMNLGTKKITEINSEDNLIEEGEDAKFLIFKVRETADGNIITSLDMAGFETLELLGCVPLMEKAVQKVIKKSSKND